MPGDVGAVSNLLNTVLSWVLDPDGYAKWTAGRQREKVTREAIKAFHAGDVDALNSALVDLKRLQ